MTSLSAFALKDDTNKPINIVSDNQSLDMENSVVTFTDNVVITQGSILIKANKVVLTADATVEGCFKISWCPRRNKIMLNNSYPTILAYRF